VKLFNNQYGINVNSDINAKDNITLNNSQIFNNTQDGLFLNKSNRFTINNTHIYNNGGNGIYFAGAYNNG
jgi:hypothetical protein